MLKVSEPISSSATVERRKFVTNLDLSRQIGGAILGSPASYKRKGSGRPGFQLADGRIKDQPCAYSKVAPWLCNNGKGDSEQLKTTKDDDGDDDDSGDDE